MQLLELDGKELVPDVKVIGYGAQKPDKAISENTVELLRRAAGKIEERRAAHAERQPPEELRRFDLRVPHGVLPPEDGKRAEERRQREREKNPPARRRLAFFEKMRREHAERIEIEHAGKLIHPERELVRARRDESAAHKRRERHKGERKRRALSERAGEQRKKEVKLHLHRDGPKRGVKARPVIRIHGERVRKREVREKIAPERGAPDGAAAHGSKDCRSEYREQIARQYPAEPPVIKPLHVRDPSAGADKRTVEQKAGEQQREIHKHVPAPHDALKIKVMPADDERRIEP